MASSNLNLNDLLIWFSSLRFTELLDPKKLADSVFQLYDWCNQFSGMFKCFKSFKNLKFKNYAIILNKIYLQIH